MEAILRMSCRSLPSVRVILNYSQDITMMAARTLAEHGYPNWNSAHLDDQESCFAVLYRVLDEEQIPRVDERLIVRCMNTAIQNARFNFGTCPSTGGSKAVFHNSETANGPSRGQLAIADPTRSCGRPAIKGMSSSTITYVRHDVVVTYVWYRGLPTCRQTITREPVRIPIQGADAGRSRTRIGAEEP
jgi:hypothetical protein